MSGDPEPLIATLAADLRPVRRLPGPGLRALSWMGAVIAIGLVLAAFANMAEVKARLMMVPDLRWAAAGAALTAAAAAWAAFQVSVPGRPLWWGLLPVGPAVLWLGASGWGCLRDWVAPGHVRATMHTAMQCATFIMLLSVPLSALLVVMLRRAAPLWPGLAIGLGGLAAGAAAATLLVMFHPEDASAIDLLMTVTAVLLVVGVTRLAARA